MVDGAVLAEASYLVFNINYRLAPAGPFQPRSRTSRRGRGSRGTWRSTGGDAGRVVLAGESAGANLVTALTVACCYDRHERARPPARARGVRRRQSWPAAATCR
ncbi:MAG: alpha/beta hydrolase fold domain-containing protein [Myxococcales bacterium]